MNGRYGEFEVVSRVRGESEGLREQEVTQECGGLQEQNQSVRVPVR